MDRLGRLADKCEQVNSNLGKVVAESHKILDNSFLASQAHLTNPFNSPIMYINRYTSYGK